MNSNNIDWKKDLDFSIENLEKDEEDYKVDSFSNIAHCSEDIHYSNYDNDKENIIEYKNNDNSIIMAPTQYSPRVIENSINNQLLNYGKKLDTLISISNNLLLKKKRKQKTREKSKKSDDSEKNFSKHTKYSTDNMQRRCKGLILNYTLEFLNYQIKKIYDGNIGNGIHIRKLFDISQEQKANNSVDYIRNFMNKTVKEIFSAHISKRYTSFLPNHNQIVINRALNEKDEYKREKFEKLFNLTFEDCIQKFLGKDNSEDSEGFPLFSHIKYKLHDDKDYLDRLEKFLNEFVDKINSKKRKYPNKFKIIEKVKQ
jgi:hypothetical protein